jgi:hypothetical protein
MPSIINATTSTGLVSSADNSGSLQLATNNGTTAVTITTAQNVGVGTASPLGKFDVGGASTAASNTGVYVHGTDNASYGQFVAFRRNGSNSLIMGDAGAILGSGGGASVFYTYGANYQAFWTNGTERMRISSNGDVLVGTTSADATVLGARIIASATIPQISVAVSTTSNNYLLYNTTASAYRFFVTSAGVINATTTTITAISDQRWKENIRDLDDGLEKVLALKPRKFDWKEGKGEDKKNARGFIAQELETVFPDMVTDWIDPAPKGEESYKAVNANLIPTLVKAIQELKAQLDESNLILTSVKTELDATKAEVAALKGVA